MNRLLRLHGSRHPHEILTSLWTAVVGVVGLILLTTTGTGISATVGRALHAYWEHAFYISLILSSGCVLYGAFRKKKIDGLLTERIGLFAQGGAYLVYVAVVLTESGTGALLASILPTALVAANGVRIAQIRADLGVIKDYLTDHPEDRFLWTR